MNNKTSGVTCHKTAVVKELLLPLFQHACQTNNVSFIYTNLDFPANVQFAIQIKDLSSVQKFCLQHNISYIEYVYAQNCKSQYSIDLILSLYDTQGLKQMCPDFWQHWKHEYHNPQLLIVHSKNAIVANDALWLEYMFNNSSPLTASQFLIENPSLIESAYQIQHLEAAEVLINFGAVVDPKYFAHTNMVVSEADYVKHTQTMRMNSLAATMVKLLYSLPIANNVTQISENIVLLKNTYTFEANNISKMYSELFSLSKAILPLQDVLIAGSIMAIEHPIKIFFHNRTEEDRAFYRSAIIGLTPYSNAVIYQSSQGINTPAIFVHEFGHYIFDVLFQNNAITYKQTDAILAPEYYNAYHDSIRSTFKNALQLIGSLPKHELSYEQIILHSRNIVLLDLIDWHMMNTQKALSTLPQSQIQAIADTLYNKYNPSSNIATTKTSKTCSTYKCKVNYLNTFLQRKNLSDADLWILYRLYDFAKYDSPNFHVELLNRLPELLFSTYTMSGYANSTILSSLKQFWLNHVTPRVQKYIDSTLAQVHDIEAKNHTQEQLDNFFLFAYTQKMTADLKSLKLYVTTQTIDKVENDIISRNTLDDQDIEMLKIISVSFINNIEKLIEKPLFPAVKEKMLNYLLSDLLESLAEYQLQYVDTIAKISVKFSAFPWNCSYSSDHVDSLSAKQCVVEPLRLVEPENIFDESTRKVFSAMSILEDHFSYECIYCSMLQGEINTALCQVY